MMTNKQVTDNSKKSKKPFAGQDEPVTSKPPIDLNHKYRSETNNFKNCHHPHRIYGSVCFICGDVVGE